MKKIKIFILIIMLFFLFLFLIPSMLSKKVYFNLHISNVKVEKIIKTRKKMNSIIDIYYKNNKIPYDKNSDYYLFYNEYDYKKLYMYSNKQYKVKIIKKTIY